MEKTEKKQILDYLHLHLKDLTEASEFNMSEAIERGMRPLERKALLAISDAKKLEAEAIQKAISFIEEFYP